MSIIFAVVRFQERFLCSIECATMHFAQPSSFYRASACYASRARHCFSKSVCPPVCPSHSGIVSKWMHISLNSFHCLIGTWPCRFFDRCRRYKVPRGTHSAGALNTWGRKNMRFSTEIAFYFETVRDRPMVTMDHKSEVIRSRSWVILSNLGRRNARV